MAEPVGQVEHDLPDVAYIGGAGTHHAGRRHREVVLVVERRLRERSKARRDAGELVAPPAERAQHVDRVRPGRGDLVEELDHRALGVLCTGDCGQGRGMVGKDLSNERGLHRGVERRAALCRQRARAEQLGQPVEHEEADVEDSRWPRAQLSPQRETSEIAGHDHGDRRERVVTLGRADHLGERASGGRTERHGHQPRHVGPLLRLLHDPKVARGCDTLSGHASRRGRRARDEHAGPPAGMRRRRHRGAG